MFVFFCAVACAGNLNTFLTVILLCSFTTLLSFIIDEQSDKKTTENKKVIHKQQFKQGAVYSTDGQCGPKYGVCPPQSCCSLSNECGTTTAHCNVSLGCKRIYGSCH